MRREGAKMEDGRAAMQMIGRVSNHRAQRNDSSKAVETVNPREIHEAGREF